MYALILDKNPTRNYCKGRRCLHFL